MKWDKRTKKRCTCCLSREPTTNSDRSFCWIAPNWEWATAFPSHDHCRNLQVWYFYSNKKRYVNKGQKEGIEKDQLVYNKQSITCTFQVGQAIRPDLVLSILSCLEETFEPPTFELIYNKVHEIRLHQSVPTAPALDCFPLSYWHAPDWACRSKDCNTDRVPSSSTG